MTCPKSLGNGPQPSKILKADHISYVQALLHADNDHKAKNKTKTKTIGHSNIYDTRIISCNSNRNHSLTCPKTWGKGNTRKVPLNNTKGTPY